MIFDYFILALKTLSHRQLRSWLTVLGIVIGITAVVSLISLGQGLQNAINEQFSTIGANRILIQPGGSDLGPPTPGTGQAKITDHDLNLIEDINGVDNAFGYTLNPAKAEFNNKVRFTYVVGIPPDPEELKVLGTGLDVGEGRQLKKGDVSKVVLGYDISHRDSMFGKEVKIGDKILIEGKSFDVVGVRKRIGNPIQDESFLIPLDTFRDIFNLEDDLSIIAANINANENVDVIAEKIKKEMRRDRHLKEGEEDFQVQTSEEVIASFNVVLQIVQAVLIGIAAISLIVGGIGIMNTMYTSVLERTKDIGILKAIGAKYSDIMQIFLIESGIIGLVGGVIGISIGVGIGLLVQFFAEQYWGTALIRASFSWPLIIGSLLFSFVVGSLAGLLPARQAAKMNPVDALRYE
ncbi:MAG TPA: ABC transporter permease [Candidatus Nanoarchaeia archaeon]|nr:ABC transporter permease [Candidatus Nanoarchaeia archaeon]